VSDTAPEPRRISRLLIVDPLDRVLLLHFRLRDGREVWIPPGGGVEAGESASDAALREVREETGVVVGGPLHLVWLRTAYYFRRDVIESYFFTRMPVTPTVVIEAVPGGPADLLEYRWWVPADIVRDTSEVEFTPRSIAARLERLFAGEVPIEPVVLTD
jgi:ADP-ribose pyrophosphatase YjhB (NUDIX family)